MSSQDLRDKVFTARVAATPLVRRLLASPQTAPLGEELNRRTRSIDVSLADEAELAVKEIRCQARLDAFEDQACELNEKRNGSDPAAKLKRLEEKRHIALEEAGQLRADRAKIDARLRAELAALRQTQKLIRLRLRNVDVSFV